MKGEPVNFLMKRDKERTQREITITKNIGIIGWLFDVIRPFGIRKLGMSFRGS